ncbi:SDR family NAD(P)-dependent oxidoreductase [Microbacterium sp. NPDC077644]|uniref:SDR family NAD(P)-dependent oxidoreductase n=1 Tax=Microbacterium sp. NPDC077644 TaxID=3155055 RepID=UPI00344C5505
MITTTVCSGRGASPRPLRRFREEELDSGSELCLRGSSVAIIGAGQGMGEASARRFAQAGARVIVMDIDRRRAENVAQSIVAAGGNARALTVDVLDDENLIAALERARVEAGGMLEHLVTIVGMAGWSRLTEMSGEMWDAEQARNLRYFFIAARTVALMDPAPERRTITAIASVDGIRSAPFHAAYGAAKAGLVNLVKSMCIEWAPMQIRINAIAPGAIVSPRIPLADEASERARFSRIPAGVRGHPDDIANAALFLASPLASYITGQTLAVDGGLTALGPLDYSDVLAGMPGSGQTLGQ